MSVELTSFVGRRGELAHARGLLESARLVTLTGPGGVGKTRLARQLARGAARAFPDGVWFVELVELTDPSGLSAVLASALSLEVGGREELDAVVSYLQSRHALLVLDNCEHLVDACAEMTTRLLLQAPALRVVATSREPLRVIGEQLMTVPPLPLPAAGERSVVALASCDAVALLVDRARLVQPGFAVASGNAGEAARLCTLLEGIPLAIELAAARLRILSLGQLLERLEGRFDDLSSSVLMVSERHRTLAATMEWSFRLCSPVEQRVWVRMSVFEGGADLEAVEAVCAEVGGSVFEAVAGLVDKSVLLPEEVGGRVRYRMLETLRQFARLRLAEADAVGCRARHRDYYVELTRTVRAGWFGPDQRDWLARLRADQGNLRAALEHALTGGSTRDQGLELTSNLYWYWPLVGAMHEGMRWTTRALAAAEPTGALGLRALNDAAHLAGTASGVVSDDPAMGTLAQRAVALQVDPDTPAVRGDVWRARAQLCAFYHDFEGSRRAHEEALREYELTDDVFLQMEALEGLASMSGSMGRHEEAIGLIHEIMTLCEEHGEEVERVELMWALGELHLILGHHDEALTAVRTCLAAAPGLNERGVGRALAACAWIHGATSDGQRAAVLMGAARSLLSQMGGGTEDFTRVNWVECESSARAVLGDEAFDAAYQRGSRMTRDEAVAFARDERPRASEGGRRRSGSAAGARLSRREREVAELVARGLSNKEIAVALVISQRTAEGHVAKIMDKLGFGSRAMIAAWVAEQHAAARPG